MNTIYNGGISSKNTPLYTKDGFLISLKKDYSSGIYVDAFLTKDNELILVDETISKILGLDEKKIKEKDYKQIKNINCGTKVKNQSLISLQELINIFNDNLFLIVNLCNNDLSSKEIDIVNSFFLKNNFNKLIICSKSVDILKRLDNLLNKCLYIAEESDWNYSFNYYVSEEKFINKSIINNLVRSNSTVFLLDSKEQDLIKKLGNNAYIITRR